jgi:L-lactate dehydrogenase complex protein LldG
MTEARRKILDKLGAAVTEEYGVPKAIQPAFVARSESLASLLKRKLEAVHTSVDIVGSAEQVGQSIKGFLNAHGSPLEVGFVSEIDTNSIPSCLGIGFYPCQDMAACHTILTSAAFGIAETGTVVLPSGLQRPTLANFLPDNCIILLDEVNIRPCMEDAFSSVQNSDAGMPRALNLISGPSKTADIEQTLVYGAHGPIQLHVIIRSI